MIKTTACGFAGAIAAYAIINRNTSHNKGNTEALAAGVAGAILGALCYNGFSRKPNNRLISSPTQKSLQKHEKKPTKFFISSARPINYRHKWSLGKFTVYLLENKGGSLSRQYVAGTIGKVGYAVFNSDTCIASGRINIGYSHKSNAIRQLKRSYVQLNSSNIPTFIPVKEALSWINPEGTRTSFHSNAKDITPKHLKTAKWRVTQGNDSYWGDLSKISQIGYDLDSNFSNIQNYNVEGMIHDRQISSVRISPISQTSVFDSRSRFDWETWSVTLVTLKKFALNDYTTWGGHTSLVVERIKRGETSLCFLEAGQDDSKPPRCCHHPVVEHGPINPAEYFVLGGPWPVEAPLVKRAAKFATQTHPWKYSKPGGSWNHLPFFDPQKLGNIDYRKYKPESGHNCHSWSIQNLQKMGIFISAEDLPHNVPRFAKRVQNVTQLNRKELNFFESTILPQGKKDRQNLFDYRQMDISKAERKAI